MNLSKKGTQGNDTKLSTLKRSINLNPNAAEFIPFSHRTPASLLGSTSASVAMSKSPFATLGKAVLDRSGSSFSNNSDEETQQLWNRQLPDDIIPDFKVMGEEESQGLGDLSLAGLSLHHSSKEIGFPSTNGIANILDEQQILSLNQINESRYSEKMRYSASSYREDPASVSCMNLSPKSWDGQFVKGDQLLASGRDGSNYNGNSGHGFMNNLHGEHRLIEHADMNPLEFLASKFPSFAAESLAEVYFANGGDLNLTIEMLTQLELQVDAGFNHIMDSRTFSAPNLNAMDFPALTAPDNQNDSGKYAGDDLLHIGKDNMLMLKTGLTVSSGGSIDFAPAVRKLASHDSGLWRYNKNGSGGSVIGASRNSHMLASIYKRGQGGGIYGDRLPTRNSTQSAPVWLETGEAVANLYSELREEASENARIRNAFFEQAHQAYLVGNKALAKELSVKGQLYNLRMKTAHGKAQESICCQRNSVAPEMQDNGRGQDRMIDLHGLHVSEAIHVLKNELHMLRSMARAAGQRLQVCICVGTGHHTRGSHTPARLPIAVQRYLLEDEGLNYSEAQPGLLRVVVY